MFEPRLSDGVEKRPKKPQPSQRPNLDKHWPKPTFLAVPNGSPGALLKSQKAHKHWLGTVGCLGRLNIPRWGEKVSQAGVEKTIGPALYFPFPLSAFRFLLWSAPATLQFHQRLSTVIYG